MLKSYLLTSFRSVIKHRWFSLLNVAGLAVGLAAAMLMFQYTDHELSFDQFHVNKDAIYRIDHAFLKDGGVDFQTAKTFPRVGPAMKEDFPEVERYCRIVPKYQLGYIQYGDHIQREEDIHYADSSFFTMFSYPWIAGDKRTALTEIHTAVIEEKTAKKYFGDEDPIGKRLTMGSFNGIEEFEIRGVFRCPENSHLKMSIVFSYPSLIAIWGEGAHTYWDWYDFQTYVQLRPGADASALEAKLPAFIDKNGGERLGSKRVRLSLRPVTDIHLHSNLMMEAYANGSAGLVNFLMILGTLVMIIAWINYINLYTARAIERAKEVGIRKVHGSSRAQLAGQFIAEAFIINFAALLVAVALVYTCLPMFNELTGKTFTSAILTEPGFYLRLAILFFAGSLLSGFYPALVLSSYRPIAVLKGTLKHSASGILLRKGLVVGQFVASAALIAGTMVVYSQMRHLQNVDLGINVDNTVIVRAPEVVSNRDRMQYHNSLETFRQRAMNDHRITHGSLTSIAPGKRVEWYSRARRIGSDEETQPIVLYQTTVDDSYFSAYNVQLAGGRFFSTGIKEDSANIILNEKAAAMLGFRSVEDAIQGKVTFRGDTFSVIGVIRNYHQESPKEEFRPSVFRLSNEERSYFSFRYSGGNEANVVAGLQKAYSEIFPGMPFSHSFVNDQYDAQYANERKFFGTFATFASIAIIIASLGLFGLSSYAIVQRTREVGIRKILGSSDGSLFMMFCYEFFAPVLIGNLIATPIVWFAMNAWLSGFAEHTEVSGFVFVVTLIITALLAFATICYHALKTVRLNPATAIRYD